MKKICLLIIILSVLVAGCENKSIEERKQKGFNESKTYSFPESKEKFSITFKTQTNASFCDDKTYFVFYTCLESQFDEKKSRDIFDSMSCKREWKTPNRTSKKLGLVVSPQNESDIKSYFLAFNFARDNDVQITHHYASWGENDWGTTILSSA